MNIQIQDICHDLIISIPVLIWILFVINYLSRWVYGFAFKKGYPQGSATYFGRKTIHILASGLVTLSLPFLYKEPLVPLMSGIALALYTYLPHRKKQLYNWFQVKENIYEVNFCLMWGLSILFGWMLTESFLLGMIPGLFISFGDGVTGVVRNLKYKRRNKGWEGSLAMLTTCILIGAWKMGWAGIIAGVVATVFEKIEGFDDNVSIVVSSFAVLAIFHFFFPALITPLF